jgi:hypothetical protein
MTMRSVFPQEAEDEVGANHPQHLSQTFEPEQRWWTGIFVEPQPELAEVLRGRQSERVFAEACRLS